MNGLEVIPILKEDYPHLQVIIVTKYNDPKFVREQGAGSWEQGAGSWEQGAGSREQGAKN